MGKKFPIEYWLSDEGLARVRLWANDGLSQGQIARQMGCGLTTLKKYLKSERELLEASNYGVDRLIDEVEATAYQMAKGYYKRIVEYEEREVDGVMETTRLERLKYFAPNYKMAEFILSRRRLDKWDKLKHEEVKQKKAVFDKTDIIQVVIGDGGAEFAG